MHVLQWGACSIAPSVPPSSQTPGRNQHFHIIFNSTPMSTPVSRATSCCTHLRHGFMCLLILKSCHIMWRYNYFPHSWLAHLIVQPCTPSHDSWANFKLWFSIMIYNSNFQFLFFVFNLIMQVPSSLLKTREHSQAHCQVSSGWVIQVSLAHYFSLTSQQFTNRKQLFCPESALLADIFSTASELCLQTFSIENSILVCKTGRWN